MSTIQQAHKALSEIDDFGRHRDANRLIRAFQGIKQLGVQAMCEGDITACKAIAFMIENLHHKCLDADNRKLNQQFLECYVEEFKPMLFTVANMCDVPLSVHQQIVDTVIEHEKLDIDSQMINVAKNMAESAHFAPLARLLDAVFTKMRESAFDPKDGRCDAIATVFNRCAPHIDWKQDQVTPLLQTVVKHALLMNDLIQQCSSYAQSLWDEVINPGLLHAVQTEACPELLETLFHEYAYSNAESYVFTELLNAGMQISIERMHDYLNRSYDASQGQYPYSAIYLHLCSGGGIPLLVDFTMIGGKPVGMFLNECLRTWGSAHPEIAVQLAHAFLDHNPGGAGLYAKPLPRQLLEHSERLREDSLGADLGL
jgi:hypothetical protein